MVVLRPASPTIKKWASPAVSMLLITPFLLIVVLLITLRNEDVAPLVQVARLIGAGGSFSNGSSSEHQPLTPLSGPQGSSIALEEDPKSEPDLLLFDWPLHLGWNNIRVMVEGALWYGHLLNRVVVLPPYIRIQSCANTTWCKELLREQNSTDKRVHYPIEKFLSLGPLQSVAVSSTEVEERLKREVSVVIPDEFATRFMRKDSEIKDPTLEVWVDRLPGDLSSASNFTVYKGMKDKRLWGGEWAWLLDPVGIKVSHVKSLAQELRKIKSPVLKLTGQSVCYPCSPGFFHSKQAWSDFLDLRRKHVQYAPVVHEIADVIVDTFFGPLNETTKEWDFVGVHLRRGDFTDLWGINEAFDEYVAKLATCPASKYYVATNEKNLTKLVALRNLGALFWEDVEKAIPSQIKATVEQLAFHDFIGLIEQVVLAKAKIFVGTRSSSVSGHVLNLRGDWRGTWDPYYMLGEKTWEPPCHFRPDS